MVSAESAAVHAPESAQQVLTLLESSRVFGCVVLDHAGNIRWVNGLFGRWLESLAGDNGTPKRFANWLPEDSDRGALTRALQGEGGSQLAFELGLGEGARIPVVGDLSPLGIKGSVQSFAGIFYEAAADQKLKAGMQRSARLEALGSLTSGVAHDFNNLLTILVGNLSLVAEDLRDEPKHFPKLKAARDAARRGGDLIKQLLSFARQEPVESKLINPAKVISRISPLIQRALGSRISFELDLDENVDPIQGNSAQLESVIVNLAVNARDAIEHQGRVRISVSSPAAEASDSSAAVGTQRNLIIEVSDDGTGIPSDIVDRVFDPFFTTKANGRGSGLGLSMVKLYAEQFRGTAELISQQDAGTTVRLRFPVSSGTIADSAAMTMPLAALPSGDESILVLARDASLNSMVDQILSVLGYQCRIAEDIGAAVDLQKAAPSDLIICDGFDRSRMLEVDAAADGAISRILTLLPIGDDKGQDNGPVLYKPFSLPDLAVAVREALDAEQ
jgi:signal transduction histidine kinase